MAKEQPTPEELNKLLLPQDNERKTAWHVEVERGEAETLGKLWKWAKEVLNTDDLNYKLLLAKDWDKETLLHRPSYRANIQILESLWNLAKEQLSPEQLNKLLLVQDDKGKAAWHVAAQ